jgi:hypothetical protein
MASAEKVHFEFCGGQRDLGAALPVTPTTTFMTSSSTKVVPQRDAHNRETRTTLGWHRGQLDGVTYFGKPRGGPGFHSNIRLYPERGIVTAWFINHMGVNEPKITRFGDAADRFWLV